MTTDQEYPRIRVRAVETLSDNWYTLRKATFDYQRSDGSWQTQSREAYDRGNGAAILLYNRDRRTVILTRQFRYPAYSNGSADGMLIEACAGLLDLDDPETAIKRETEEETGYRLANVVRLFEAYMSPGSVTEKLYFFAGEYEPENRAAAGGGEAGSTEDIEVLELAFSEALAMIDSGAIEDAKTILLLHYAALKNLIA